MIRFRQILLVAFLLWPQNLWSAPLRIVSLKPNITQTLIALGIEEEIVGITKYCHRPNAHADVVADYTSLKTENIIRLKPDLVLSSTENSQSRQYDTLASAKLRIKYLNFKTLDDLFASVKKLGEILGNPVAAEALIQRMRQGIVAAQQDAKQWQDKSFIVIVQREPLMIAAGPTYISTLLEAAGLKNTFAKNKIPYPVLDQESLIRKSPDILFDMDMSRKGSWGKDYLGRKVIAISIDDFIATPQSIEALKKLFVRMSQ